MKTIVSNDFYTVAVDPAKNRIYFTMRGSWIKEKEVQDWPNHVAEAVRLCSPGFTELIDWTGSKAILLTDYIAKAQEIAVKGGLRKAARVYDEESFAKHQMDTLTKETKFPVRSFFNRQEAEAWLDED
ncbi:MAG: hypothetical protein RDU20_04110 [Desulfomonilaceae bacterium]|nr:hypothetical protein [Desulfomonilaceae bacterium]